jgi:phosphopantetheinyl transferase (holo-ACP synthase)
MIDCRLLGKTVEAEMANKLGLSGLQCELSKNFASQVPEHRAQIRRALEESILGQARKNRSSADLPSLDLASLANLSLPPRIQDFAISISHCPTLGGFVHLPKSASVQGVGFDIEIADRVSTPVAKKVLPHAPEQFLHSAIDAGDESISGCIWAAKESSIKSMGNVLVDRQIFYGNVALTSFAKSSDDLSFQFRAVRTETVKSADSDSRSESRLETYGIVRKTDQWILALAISYSLPQ